MISRVTPEKIGTLVKILPKKKKKKKKITSLACIAVCLTVLEFMRSVLRTPLALLFEVIVSVISACLSETA